MERRSTAPVESPAGRAARTRAAVLAAVDAIVAREGATAVTTTRVAAEAGVSVGAVYRYFDSREALLLAAYDDLVAQLVETCAAMLGTLPADTPSSDAARRLLSTYLAAAEAQPAHGGLLRAMRALRSVEADLDAHGARIADVLLAPFFRRFGGNPDWSTLQLVNALLGTLVDLYLVTEDPAGRRRLRGDIEAHILLALDRATQRR